MNMPADNPALPKDPRMPDTKSLNVAVPMDEERGLFLRSIMDIDIGPVISGGDREPPIKRVALQLGLCFRGEIGECCGKPGACSLGSDRQ